MHKALIELPSIKETRQADDGDYQGRVSLRNSKKGFYRTTENPPEEMSLVQELAFKSFLIMDEIEFYLREGLRFEIYRMLPEETEHRAKRGRPKVKA
jgi:hypothetical protein